VSAIPEDRLRDIGIDPDDTRYGVTALQHFPINETTPQFPIEALPRPVSRLVKEAAKAI
jgi:hypothetical protein